MSTESLGSKLRRLRLERKLPLRKVAAMLDIDVAILSKMERGKRRMSRNIVQKLSNIYGQDAQKLMIQFLSEKVLDEIRNEANANEILQAAESGISYRAKPDSNKQEIKLAQKKIIDTFHKYFSAHSRVSKAWLFGSFARGNATENSDIDVVITVPEEKKFTLFDLCEIQEDLQTLSGRKVDVVMLNGLRPEIKLRIQKEKKVIYEA